MINDKKIYIYTRRNPDLFSPAVNMGLSNNCSVLSLSDSHLLQSFFVSPVSSSFCEAFRSFLGLFDVYMNVQAYQILTPGPFCLVQLDAEKKIPQFSNVSLHLAFLKYMFIMIIIIRKKETNVLLPFNIIIPTDCANNYCL